MPYQCNYIFINIKSGQTWFLWAFANFPSKLPCTLSHGINFMHSPNPFTSVYCEFCTL